MRCGDPSARPRSTDRKPEPKAPILAPPPPRTGSPRRASQGTERRQCEPLNFEPSWQFWIDVGGTFTDCLGLGAGGRQLRHKVLSNGVTKGITAPGSDRLSIVDATRRNDPADYWRGFQLVLFDPLGKIVDRARVAEGPVANGCLRLETPLAEIPRVGQSYELVSKLDAPILAIRWVLGLAADAPLPRVSVRLGTTRGTNALLTRQGAETALITTRGFGDLLRIGNQERPRLFELNIQKPASLFSHVVEVDERVGSDGVIQRALDERRVLQQLRDLGPHRVSSLAVCLMNSYRNPQHERAIGRLARQVGFDEISLSHEVVPLVKMISRGDTTVVDAYLNPVLRQYVDRLRQALGPHSELQLLTSAGGLIDGRAFTGKDSILSGPAGGVVGCARAAQAAGFQQAIGFDMGGTSTDVSRFDGHFELEFESQKAGVRVAAPMMSIETVAAGGGSICWFDGVKLCVGPRSAGADPGPACYGRGGPLAVTDINVFLGKIPPGRFPFPLDRSAIEQGLKKLCERIACDTGHRYTPVELAFGYLEVANANMAKAIRSVSLARGYDPREYLLVAFGGAAGQHACAIAAELGIPQILIHPDAGILSACGIGLADVTRHRVVGIYRSWEESCGDLDDIFSRLITELEAEIMTAGYALDRVDRSRSLELRYRGTDATLTIREPEDQNYRRAFERDHQQRYGYCHPDRELEVVTARAELTAASESQLSPAVRAVSTRSSTNLSAVETVTAHFEGREWQTAVFDGADLPPGETIAGPAIVADRYATTVIDPDWSAEILSGGEMLLAPSRDAHHSGCGGDSRTDPHAPIPPDPILLEVFNNQFAAIAEQMGITLRNTSSSVNVKERLDFSCALFTHRGDLVVNAPHIPVHLGAMSETVKCVIADNPDPQSGDVFVTNDPYRGGSHLPDITVVTPVFAAADHRLVFFVANRAHHAEIGGISPGSMPPFSRHLAEEGILIRNFKLVDAGHPRLDAIRELLLSGEFPTRSISDNLADLSAQIAANRRGTRELIELIERRGLPMVEAYMEHIQRAAEQKMRQALSRLEDGSRTFIDHLDDGSPICVTIAISGDEAHLDFAGTGPVLSGNLNANRAIVTAAVLYVLRCLIDEPIPLNQGVLAPVEITLPECLLNPPDRGDARLCAAVAAGNVETSQRVVDVLLGAFGMAAASQGTMNNLLFGDDSFGYYETLCGGVGATPTGPGADAIQTHMTNTRLTDPEVLEQRFPVRVRRFSIRRGSGGAGRHPGGNGIVRELEFLKKLEVALLSQRRGAFPPFGLKGGRAGKRGRNILRPRNGAAQELTGVASFNVEPGDVLVVKTPGGGGFGEPPNAPPSKLG